MSGKVTVFAVFAACLLAVPARAADVDKLLPDDSSVVVRIDVRQILDSALVKKHGLAAAEKALKNNVNIEKFLTAAGFDPMKHLSAVTLALESDLSSNKGLIILRGKFDSARIAARAEEMAKKEDRLKIESIAGQTVYSVTGGPDGPGYLAVLDNTTALASSNKGSLEEALEKQAGKRKPTLKKEFKQQIEGIEVGRGVWLVASGAALRKNPFAADDKVKEVLDRVDFVTLSVAVTDAVAVKAMLTASNDDAAKALGKDIEGGLESAKGVIAVISDNRPELAPVGELLDTLKLKMEGTSLRLQLEASAEVIQKMMKARK
jgi:hypothetical protein